MAHSHKYGDKFNPTKRKSYYGSDDSNEKITNLIQKIPALTEHFIIHHKIGEGTFSSVYLASLNNKYSHQNDCKIAIKHLIPTCSPARIIQEISCLKNIGGTDNVVSLKQCVRKDDNCAFIMPYLPHQKFSDYFTDMDVNEVKLYMRNLMIALRRVHSFKVIHRDVKPANFLYDRESKRFLLVDFGLAENVERKKLPTDEVQNSVSENTPVVSKKRKHSHLTDENDIGEQELHSRKRQALHPLTNVANVKDGPPVLRKAIESPPSIKKGKSASNHSTANNKPTDESNIDSKKCTSKPPKLDTSVDSSKTHAHNMLSPKRLPLVINTAANIINNVSPSKHFSTISNVGVNEKKVNHLVTSHSINYDSKFIPRRLDLSKTSNEQVFKSLLPSREEKPNGPSYVRVQNSQVQPVFQTPNSNAAAAAVKKMLQTSALQCRCDGKPQVCNVCLTRQKQHAPRAGTPGYRPPEVLLKHQLQTTAVDVWSAGVIFLSILSGCYPFFQSRDDLTALTEIITLFGTSPIKNLATKLGKNLICSCEKPAVNLQEVCQRLRRRRLEANSLTHAVCSSLRLCTTCDHHVLPSDGCVCQGGVPTPRLVSDLDPAGVFPDAAYDLLLRLLDVDPETRITAAQALNHPFLHIESSSSSSSPSS